MNCDCTLQGGDPFHGHCLIYMFRTIPRIALLFLVVSHDSFLILVIWVFFFIGLCQSSEILFNFIYLCKTLAVCFINCLCCGTVWVSLVPAL